MTSMREPGPTSGAEAAPPIGALASCVICSMPTLEIEGCCSLACAEQAQREVRHNVACLRLLRLDEAAMARRLHLAERNGRLSSALLRYRPRFQPTID